jgi:hypothetical protein
MEEIYRRSYRRLNEKIRRSRDEYKEMFDFRWSPNDFALGLRAKAICKNF